MRLIFLLAMLSCFAMAQGKSAAKSKSAATPNQATIEKAWADFQKKDAAGVSSIVSDDLIEIWADGSGAHDKKATLAGIDGDEAGLGAVEHQVPLIENPPLAQALYKSVEVGQEIPPHLYRAVAEILAYIYRLMNVKTW